MNELIVQSEALREVVRVAARVAATDANILITGESGTGKGALAEFIHDNSPRGSAPLVKIDCGALPQDLLEAELFGYERGAFTGATETKPGRLEGAEGGTLLLDEIAHLSPNAQAKFLRVIAQRSFERLGSNLERQVDARLIALTNVDLEQAVQRGAFRADLFYRLNVVRLDIPPLSARQADIAPLARQFLRHYAAKHGRPVSGLTPDALALLEAHDWPGNARELANAVERAVIITTGPLLTVEDCPHSLRVAARTRQQGRQMTLAEVEADYVRSILTQTKGNKALASRILGISRKSLYERMARYGLE